MTTKEKPATGCNREAGNGVATTRVKSTPIRTHLKAAIVNLALWGLIPDALATWMIRRGGLLHE